MCTVAKMSKLLLLVLLLCAVTWTNTQSDAERDGEPSPVHIDGRSFFFLGTIFRRWRDRWIAFHNPGPYFAGAGYPVNGYFNCPSFGCNPASIGPQPGFYPVYYGTSLQQQQQQQQQQQAQGNSNVYIYQTDQNSANSGANPPFGPGFYGPVRQPTPLGVPPQMPLPPSALLPPESTLAQASASSFEYGSPGPIPICGPNPLSCALG